MANYASVYARVNRGALLLDDRLPDWALHIRASELDMTSSCNCVLGQLARRHKTVRDYLVDAVGPVMAARGTSYSIAALFVFGKWPLAATLEEYGFAGDVWADLGKERRANLLDSAWLTEARSRGGLRGGRPYATLDASMLA
jgi:hypothetical protein